MKYLSISLILILPKLAWSNVYRSYEPVEILGTLQCSPCERVWNLAHTNWKSQNINSIEQFKKHIEVNFSETFVKKGVFLTNNQDLDSERNIEIRTKVLLDKVIITFYKFGFKVKPSFACKDNSSISIYGRMYK